jgi:glycosyltransferase involved in cell wall biosynthesis
VRLLSNPDEARRLGAAARERVDAGFAVERCADTYERLYRRLAREPSKEEEGS